MSHFNVSQLRPVLVNDFIDESNLLNSTWMELNPIKWLLAQKHKNGENKSWDQLSSKDYLYFRAARNARKLFGMPAITDSDLANYLKDLTLWEAGLETGARKMALNNLIRFDIDTTAENKKRELEKTRAIAKTAEEKRIADAKACYNELLELINGNFDAKAETHPDYQATYKKTVKKLQDKLDDALRVAYIELTNTIEQSIKPAEIAEAEDLLKQIEQIITDNGGNISLLQQKAAKYAQGIAMFDGL